MHTRQPIFILLFSIFLFSSFLAYSGIERYNNRMPLTSNGYISVVDDKFPDMINDNPLSINFWNKQSRGVVKLVFDKGNTSWTTFPTAEIYTVNVPVQIQGFTFDYENQEAVPFSHNKTLSIVVSSNGQVIKDLSSFVVDGAHQISAITFADASDQSVLNYMAVEVEIEVERFYEFSTAASSVQAWASEGNSKISFCWPSVEGAEGYQLEYAYVNNYGTGNVGYVDPYLFKYNSTRIDLSSNSFSMPNIYEKGYLIYRVRAYGKYFSEEHHDFFNNFSEWSTTDNAGGGIFSSLFSSSAYIYLEEADSDQKNKQSAVSFAEDGKCKFSVNYFDGSLRNRQSQVKLNSEDIVLVGETKYDYLGRGTLSVLPVPKGDDKLVYSPLFNTHDTGLEYTAHDFDLSTTVTSLGTQVKPLDDSNGAGKYYSDDDNLTGNDKYIPDAEGYPVIRTIFTEDNTGRVKVQGGLGPVFQPGLSDDKTTRYDYATPFQEELDILFGAEVGYAKYYKKDMVTDPNNQSTVSYTDMKGNVIATALAGVCPENLLPLTDPDSAQLKINILKSANADTNFIAGSIVLQRQFISDREQYINVDYLLNSDELSLTECGNFCFECVYDIELLIMDQDSNFVEIDNITPSELNIHETVSGTTLAAINGNSYDISSTGDCAEDVNLATYQWEEGELGKVHLYKGTYTIKKVLTLNQEALNEYTNDYIDAISVTGGCLDYQAVYDSYVDSIDYSMCNMTCLECRENLLNLDMTIYTSEDTTLLSQLCDKLCNVNISNPICSSGYQAMLADVSIHGQYGQVMNAPDVINGIPVEPLPQEYNPAIFPLSIFNVNNVFPLNGTIDRDWRHPENGHYHDIFGNTAKVAIEEISPGNYNPPVISGATITTNPVTHEKEVEPHQLANVEDFLDKWDPIWAESLVYHHPEYKYYETCVALQASHDFDMYIMNLNDYEYIYNWDNSIFGFDFHEFEAYPTSSDPLFNAENWPFEEFTVYEAEAQFSSMLSEYIGTSPNTYSLMEAAYIISRGTNSVSCLPPYQGITTIQDGDHWNAYKMLYFSLKQKMIDFLNVKESIAEYYYNGCMSPEDYNWGQAHGFFLEELNTTPYLDQLQMCCYNRVQPFADKTPRFPSIANSLGLFGNTYTSEECYSNTTWGQVISCPEALDTLMANFGNLTDLYFYDQCDQCPVERDLQLFLLGLVNANELTTASNLNLNCNIPEYSPDLNNAITGSPASVCFLDAIHSSGTQELNMTLTLNSAVECKIYLKIEDDLNLSDVSLYDFDDIISLCCLYDYEGSYLIDPSNTDYNNLNDFTIIAIVDMDTTDPDYDTTRVDNTKEITIYGAISCIEFNGCGFDNMCVNNDAGNNLLELLRKLNTDYDFVTTQSMYVSPEFYPYLTGELYNYFDDGYGFEWNITSIIQGGYLYVKFVTSPTGHSLTLSFDITAIGSGNITDVISILPDPENSDNIILTLRYENSGIISVGEFTASGMTGLDIGDCSNEEFLSSQTLISNNNIENILIDEFLSDIESVIADPDNWNCSVSGQNYHCTLSESINGSPINIDAYFYYGLQSSSDCYSYFIENISNIELVNGNIEFSGILGFNNNSSECICSSKYNRFDASIDYNSQSVLTSTCNEAEIHNLETYLNDFLDNSGTITSEMTLTGFSTSNCTVHFYIAEGEYTGIGSNGYEENEEYSLSQIVEVERIVAYNGHAYEDLILNRIDFEVYVRLQDDSQRKLYAVSDCFAPDCWCKKNIAISNGDFSVTGDYYPSSAEPEFWSDIENIPVMYVNKFGSETSYSFNGSTFSNSGNPYLALDFIAQSTGDITLWGNNLPVEPNTEYDFSCELFYVGSTPLKIDLRELTDDPADTNPSLFTSRGGYVSHYDSPENTQIIIEPNIDGYYIDFNQIIGSTTMNKIILRGSFNSGLKTDIDLGIMLNVTYGTHYYLAMDNVTLKKQEVCACEIKPFPAVDTVHIMTCEEQLLQVATFQAMEHYEQMVNDYIDQFQSDYINHCLNNINETFSMTLSLMQDKYTLYYYDLAGNLIRTVPPKGVVLANLEDDQEDITNAREHPDTYSYQTSHTMSTVYKYNTLGQLTAQYMPDHEQFSTTGDADRVNYSTMFWYDKLGRIVASQNSKQFFTDPDIYSYTIYDDLGRIEESGVVNFGATNFSSFVTSSGYVDYASFKNGVSNATAKIEVVKTNYSEQTTVEIPYFQQENLRNRVSYTTIDEDGDGIYEFATYYSYDIHGNVKTLLHEIVELEEIGQNFKRIDYDYDLISGNVKLVSYQRGYPDQFYHKYFYDDDNRITNVETSDDFVNWTQDAKYFYYKHGSLARVELGNDKIQAMDYAYTLQGWLKGVNSDILTTDKDIGKDGYTGLIDDMSNTNQYVGNDMFGFSLGYYNGDYSPAGGTSADFIASPSSMSTGFMGARKDLFNGNISHMVTSSKHVNDQSQRITLGYAYNYDQINRIRSMAAFTGISEVLNCWSPAGYPTAAAYYSYDKNGNLDSIKRYNRNAQMFDDFSYNYIDEQNNNRLGSVTEPSALNGVEDTDIDELAGPYSYDKIGNLISDPSEGISDIEWTNSGKVKAVLRDPASELNELQFKYDPMGNRIVKMTENQYFPNTSLEFYTKTYYIRDAQGNIMATYEKKSMNTFALEYNVQTTFTLKERPVYGTSRIAVNTEPLNLVVQNSHEGLPIIFLMIPQISSHTNGYKEFELTNHLGNVMAVVTDLRTPVVDGGIITSYNPDLIIAKDYFPFGMEMSGRYGGIDNPEPGDKYRFGFNGMEKDDEITGQTGSVYTAMFWEYDARIGRRWNVDPVSKPWMSSYQTFSNNPIARIDPNGDDDYFSSNGKFLYRDNSRTDYIRIIPQEKVDELVNKYQENLLYLGKNVVHIPISVQSEFSQNSVLMSEYRWGMSIKDGKVAVAKIGKFYSRSTEVFDGSENIIGQSKNGSIMSSGRNDNNASIKHIGISITHAPATKSGYTSWELDNVGNFRSVLAHEKYHYENHVLWNENSSMYEYDTRPVYETELEAHYFQVGDQTWGGTTETFREAETVKIQGYYEQITDSEKKKEWKDRYAEKGVILK